ncbi:hypothetical protein NESM_000607100 [Novymonas esmeraldas]|uniref:Uncharacterized protein n=1 Tax=Novymonas esmeraldas TaxID=1808958 RepID=A0AAW0ESI9_9TRYP
MSQSPSPSPMVPPTWSTGHAVASASRCCTAYRHRYLVYAASDTSVAIVDTAAEHPSGLAVEARWRQSMRVCLLAAPHESISVIAGHPEKDVLCIGTTQHGLYITSLTSPALTEAAKLPRSVTGDCIYGATFLFTASANYLAFSSLLPSRPADPTPHRLSLWGLDAKALLWRGAMGPLQSMCSFALHLSFAACNAGKVGLFSVQGVAGSSGGAVAEPAAKTGERSRLVVLSRHCSAVEELRDADYTCCVASPVEGEETYLALTTGGFLVAVSGSTGSVVRWMDCKVPSATALCCVGAGRLLLTGHLARLFDAGTWEFEGKVKWQDALASGSAAGAPPPPPPPEATAGDQTSAAPVFTCGADAGDGALVLFHAGGALSLFAVEAKAHTQRLNLQRVCVFAPPPLGPAGVAQVWSLSAVVGCWWTPQAVLFTAPPGGALLSAHCGAMTCATLHPPSGVVIAFDVARHALVAFGRGAAAAAACEVGSIGAEADESVVDLASSPAGDVVYALVAPAAAATAPAGGSAAALRLRRYRCGWAQTASGNGGGGNGGGARVLQLERLKSSAVATVPAGTTALAVFTSSDASSAADADHVVAVQRSSLVALASGSAPRDRAAPVPAVVMSSLPTYTHADVIERVVPCRDGLLVAGVATTAYVQLKAGSRWVMRSLAEAPPPSLSKRRNGSDGDGAPSTHVAAAAVRHRPDTVVVCRGSRLSAWQLGGDSPTLVATCTVAAVARALCCAEAHGSPELRVWVLGSAGLDEYALELPQRPAALRNGAEKLLPPPRAVAEDTKPAAAASPSPTPARVAPTPAAAVQQQQQQQQRQQQQQQQRRTARTPRVVAPTATASAEQRRQRRTVSAGAPSSRELNDRFDELTGFYARQRRDNQSSEHARTPRSVGPSRRVQAPTADSTAAPPHTPRDPPVEAPTRRAGTASVAASAVDVSALTIDSPPLLRAGAAAASLVASPVGLADDSDLASVDTVSRSGGALSVKLEKGAVPGPTAWRSSPPLRRDVQRGAGRQLVTEAEDAVLRSSTSNNGRAATPPLLSVSEKRGAEVRGVTDTASTATSATTQFTAQARQLRESLLHLQELLERSSFAETASDVSLAAAEEASVQGLPALLTTVAVQLQMRQGRRSGESSVAGTAHTPSGASVAGGADGRDAVAAPHKASTDAYAAVAAELARIQAQNVRLEEQNRVILEQLRGRAC